MCPLKSPAKRPILLTCFMVQVTLQFTLIAVLASSITTTGLCADVQHFIEQHKSFHTGSDITICLDVCTWHTKQHTILDCCQRMCVTETRRRASKTFNQPGCIMISAHDERLQSIYCVNIDAIVCLGECPWTCTATAAELAYGGFRQ